MRLCSGLMLGCLVASPLQADVMSCETLAKAEKFFGDSAKAAEFQAIGAKIDYWQKFRGGRQPHWFEGLRVYDVLLREYLELQNRAAAAGLMTGITASMHQAYFNVLRLEPLVAELNKAGPGVADLSEAGRQVAVENSLRIELENSYKALGQTFDQYTRGWSILEKTAAGGTDVGKTNAASVMHILENQSKRTLGALMGRRELPTVQQVRDLFDRSPVAVLARENSIYETEFWHAWRGIGLRIVGAGEDSPVVKLFANVLPTGVWGLKSIARTFHNSLAWNEYFPRLDEIMLVGAGPLPVEQQYSLLFNHYATEGTAFLTAYFRRIDTQPYRQKLLDHAKDKDQPFYQALTTASKSAQDLGPLSSSLRGMTQQKWLAMLGSAMLVYAGKQFFFRGDNDDKDLPDAQEVEKSINQVKKVIEDLDAKAQSGDSKAQELLGAVKQFMQQEPLPLRPGLFSEAPQGTLNTP